MKRYVIATICLLLCISQTVAQVDMSGKRLSLEFEDVPLSTVLNMIAAQNGLNVVISGDVSGTVSIRLQDVELEQALDALLVANGYTYYLRGDVVVVKSLEATSANDLTSQKITLKYLDPVTAQKAIEPRLSEFGSVVILDKTAENQALTSVYSPNRIVITDYPNIVEDLVAFVLELDVKERSILIEARIIETTIDNDRSLGFNWPTTVAATLGGADDGSGSGVGDGVDLISDQNSGVWDPNNGSWTWGKLSVSEMQVVLNLLEQDGNSRLVSDPRIATLENHEAIFRFEVVIPVQTINRFTEGASSSDIVTWQDNETGIFLTVTPRINEGGTITLDVHPTVEDIIGFQGTLENRQPITESRSIDTRITIENGETVALGGLLKEEDTETVQRVPVLGHIPLLGKLFFSHKETSVRKTDLIILITPHILD